ncbi:Aste57867_20500 [Aphanomyces stellatus]|uniref:Aste57867_20500 protein n=1 Tax=Aphanomyces stellatus TaxID=120398 RepID=A0A485LJV2_9STRA|nr:hypothetical protein As57867_020434 [Aphanomyces stellatus]VFT97185.1 Aste57867_20500 [Aphanomyces stellatus]
MNDSAKNREYERQRKQRYRTKLQQQHTTLRWQVWQLEDVLEKSRAIQAGGRLWRDVAIDAQRRRSASTVQNSKLRAEVRRYEQVLRTLQKWVVASVQPVLSDGRNWLHSTLLADPVSRKYGFRWLTDRVFHLAARAFSTSVGDGLKLDLRTDEDTKDILGMELFGTNTLFGDFRLAADCLWDGIRAQVPTANLTKKVVATDGDVVYLREFNLEFGTSFCKLARRYDLPTRAVLALVDLADDECFPLAEHEMRPHGFTCIVLEQVTPDITLTSQLSVHYSPLTCHGTIPFERNVAMFGVQPHPTSRNVTVARIETNALRSMLARKNMLDRLLQQRMDARAASEIHFTNS